ncbi:MAG: hypothetical protein GX855_06480 [Firmicutes bacterium]|nr:hypothetical protein [Bacillota bacterium]
MRAKQLWFGVVLILVGALILMANLGFLDWNFWQALRQLWPVLLISIGLTMLLAETRWVFIGPLVLIGAILFAAINPVGISFGFNHLMGGYEVRRSVSYSKAWDASISQGELRLQVPAGTINLMGSPEQLVSGRVFYRKGMPVWGYQQQGGRGTITLSSRKVRGSLGGSQGFQGDIALGVMVPWDVKLELGAGKLLGDLRTVPITSLMAELGAGSMDLTLSDRGIRREIRIRGGASSIRLRVPWGVELRVQLKNPIGSHNLEAAGLKKTGDYWISDGYETALSAYDITVSLGIGRLELEYISPPPQI